MDASITAAIVSASAVIVTALISQLIGRSGSLNRLERLTNVVKDMNPADNGYAELAKYRSDLILRMTRQRSAPSAVTFFAIASFSLAVGSYVLLAVSSSAAWGAGWIVLFFVCTVLFFAIAIGLYIAKIVAEIVAFIAEHRARRRDGEAAKLG